MSQAGIINVGGGPVPGPTTYVENTGAATPALNILNVVTGATDGIDTSGAGNTITISMRNRLYGTVTTNDATITTAVTLPLGAIPSSYTFDLSIAGYDAAGNKGACYTLVGAVRTNGIAAVLLPNQTLDEFEDAAVLACNAAISVSGNNAIITVQGLAATTFDWKVVGFYITVA